MKLTIGPLNALPGLRHAFFTRKGGVSQGIYASLNCGLGSKDEPERVRENRRRVLVELELEDAPLLTPYQIHSADVAVVEEAWADGEAPRADALVTDKRGLALGVASADCVPVLLADAKAGVIGAAHAGWRGALAGVTDATLEAMTGLGARRDRIIAGIGPAINQRSYEVGAEFPKPFLEQDLANQCFFCPGARAGHHLFDIKGYVARRLAQAGVSQVQCLPSDTCAEEERFFSYRRACLTGERDYGRSLSVIALEP